MTKRLIIFCKYWFVYAYWMLPIVRSVWMNVHLIGGVVHHPKPPSMWKEGDRLRWRMENSVAHESVLLGCVCLRCGVLPISKTRRLSPTASAVPPLSEKEGFVVHHPQSSFYRIDPRACTTQASFHVEGGGPLAVEDRELGGL